MQVSVCSPCIAYLLPSKVPTYLRTIYLFACLGKYYIYFHFRCHAGDTFWKSPLYRRSCSRCESVRWSPFIEKLHRRTRRNSLPGSSVLRLRGHGFCPTRVACVRGTGRLGCARVGDGRRCCGRCSAGMDSRWRPFFDKTEFGCVCSCVAM